MPAVKTIWRRQLIKTTVETVADLVLSVADLKGPLPTGEQNKSGTHIFRAQLTCEDSDAHEIAEGTTRYFGDSIDPPATSNDSRSANTGDQLDGNSFR